MRRHYPSATSRDRFSLSIGKLKAEVELLELPSGYFETFFFAFEALLEAFLREAAADF